LYTFFEYSGVLVQQMLGHTQISMTMDIYSHVLPGMQIDAVHRLHALLEEDMSSDEVGCRERK
jgi:hypothetical protein